MDDKLKQRLVGAVVLVALGVIFIPVLLDGSGRRAREGMGMEIPQRVQLPERALEALPNLEPVPTPAAAPAAPPAAQGDGLAEADAGQAASGAPATGSPRAWAIQMGSFNSRANALVLRDKLRSNGYPAFVEQPAGSAQYRVRVGPEVDKAVAERLREQLSEEYGERGMLVRYP